MRSGYQTVKIGVKAVTRRSKRWLASVARGQKKRKGGVLFKFFKGVTKWGWDDRSARAQLFPMDCTAGLATDAEPLSPHPTLTPLGCSCCLESSRSAVAFLSDEGNPPAQAGTIHQSVQHG